MREFRLRLMDEANQDLIELDLFDAKQVQPISKVIQLPDQKIFANSSYIGQLLSPITSDISSIDIFVNGYAVNNTYNGNTGRIYFYDPYNNSRIFADSFGLAKIELSFRCKEGNCRLVTPYIQVMVHPGPENFNANAIGKYTALHSDLLLYGTNADYMRCDDQCAESQHSLEDKVRLLKRCTVLMESALREIQANRAFQEEKSPSRSMASYSRMKEMTRHPNTLSLPNPGVARVAGDSFSPTTRMIQTKTLSTDTYENRVILSFLNTINRELAGLTVEIEQLIDTLPKKLEVEKGYVSSSVYMSKATILTLNHLKEDIQHLQVGFHRLHGMFEKIIPAREQYLSTPPKMTPVFARNRGYRQVFSEIQNWFALKNVTAGDIRFATAFLQITNLYEVYVLSKLGDFMKENGFTLLTSHKVLYDKNEAYFYQNSEVNNYFEFEKKDVKITLYYEPVIYEPGNPECVKTGLVRNTSLSFPRGWGEIAKGHYYTPDYILKLESRYWKGARYIIGDAKYSSYQNVKDYKVIPLVYRYLFSISPIAAEDEITGLYIFQGKETNAKQLESRSISIYDYLEKPEQHFPQVEIISMHEYMGTMQYKQFEALRQLLTIQVNRAAGFDLHLFDDNEDLILQSELQQRIHVVKAPMQSYELGGE